MRYSKIDLALVVRLTRHRWRFLTALALLGALLGFGLSFVISPGYVSTSKVLLQGERDKEELPGETEVATSSIVLDRAAERMGPGTSGADLRARVSAAVDMTVIEIAGAADTPERARQLTDEVTKQYVAFSAQISGAGAPQAPVRSQTELQRLVGDSTNRIQQLQNQPMVDVPGAAGDRIRDEIERARNDVRLATEELGRLSGQDGSSRAPGSVIQPATLPTGPASPSMPELILGGAIVLVAVGTFGHLLRLRLDTRLWEPEDVGAALGAPLLGRVEVPAVAPAGRTALQTFLHDDRGWTRNAASPIEDARTRQARYCRTLAHLRAERRTPTGLLSILVVTADGDATALAAVAELVVAGTASGPVQLVGDVQGLFESVREDARRHGVDRLVSVGPEMPIGVDGTRFEVVTVSPAHALVPETGSSGAVVVVTLGTMTGLELASLATACADAGRVLTGALLVDAREPGANDATAVSPDASADRATAGVGAS